MIYCVEDERNIRELIVYTLESSGFTARGLESGKELNAAIAERLPDLILLDIMLPGEDGLETLSRLKASEVTKEIPVIMVTAKGAEYDKVMGLDCGADDYITKPFGMRNLSQGYVPCCAVPEKKRRKTMCWRPGICRSR